jgi:hypothetical protein
MNMRVIKFLILFSMLALAPITTFAKDICLQDGYGAKWRLNFKTIKKPGQFAPVSGFRLETTIVVPVYGTAVVNGDGNVKLGLYINRSQDVPSFTDFSASIVGSQLFFSKTTSETAEGKLTDAGGTSPVDFSLTQLDCKTQVIVTNQQ